MMAVRYADCTRRWHRNREASETRYAQTADASLSDFGTSDVSPSTGTPTATATSTATATAEQDFAPVGLIARFPMILVVNPQVPAKNLQEFLAWAKGQSSPAAYASPGAGSPHHLATELFADGAKLNLLHAPYKGAAPAVQDVIGGQVPFMFVDTAAGGSHIRAGKLRAIGVASLKRVQGFDSIPTLNEQGMAGFEAYAWQGMVAPAKTPPAVIDTLNKDLNKAIGTAVAVAVAVAFAVAVAVGVPVDGDTSLGPKSDKEASAV
jgi:tripartite-type tricarboxylate transporter receptor subunit TctC